MPERATLLPLAESIADGSPIDWEGAEARAGADERAVIRQLRVLANLAVLHRSAPADTRGVSSMSIGRRSHTSPAIGNWAHLTLLERLGGGTFGDVYRAWDRHLEREVALKLLRVAEPTGDLQASRIASEGRLLARVRHPNVITVHGVDVHERRVGLWMELIVGATLEESLLRRGPFSAQEAALLGIDLCRALAALHAAGLIHRDVKAQNVMREDGGRIVLMDLGTGREIDAEGRHALSDLAGTPLYLAPEILEGAPAGERTDLYSLGVLLHHLVTGSFPVRATTIEELRDGHARGGVRLRDARADLPTSFVTIVDRAIASNPTERYASAGALEADLVKGLDDTAATTERPAGSRRGLRAMSWPKLAMAATVVAIIAVLAIPWPMLRGGRGATPIRSIAVLPLANLSGDPSQDYFADGMTEALINDLAKIGALRVIARTSVMQYRGTRLPLREVAAALDVDAILEGSVVRSGDRVRISANLVHVGSDRHVWVESYDRDVRDLLTLQNDVARTIARQIQIQITPQEEARLGVLNAVDSGAQEAYMRGRYYWNKRTTADLEKALDLFRRATARDPGYALAYAGQADAYNLLGSRISPFVAYPSAKDAATKALQIDPTLGEAQTSLAFATFVFDRDWVGAERAFQRAIQLSPGYATAHHWYGEFLGAMGRLDEALAQFDQARTLDPLSPAIRSSIGGTLYLARRYDEAIAALRASLEVGPDDPFTYLYLAWCYERKGMLAEAAEETRRGLEKDPKYRYLLAEQARLAALTGDRDTSLKIVGDLSRTAERERDLEFMAFVYAALGDKDKALNFLERAHLNAEPLLLWAMTDPLLDALRGDVRFKELLRTLRLVP